ncbi:MAG TPA: methyltransferase domain-containing protein, partial [Acidobacteriota bacterium]|nr:methyltransferase domain-containing protein [Acidobacteriota bacterium]
KYFPGKQYIGMDMRTGPGVDSIENVEELRRDSETVGTVIALNVFEHVERFWRGFEEVQRILRRDGLLLVSCPFYFHIHEFPNDYWRFTPEGLRSLLRKTPAQIIGYHGPNNRPLNVWALASGNDYPRITELQHSLFRKRIRQYARQPLAWETKVRFRISSLLSGRGPFAPYFDAEEFKTQLLD